MPPVAVTLPTNAVAVLGMLSVPVTCAVIDLPAATARRVPFALGRLSGAPYVQGGLMIRFVGEPAQGNTPGVPGARTAPLVSAGLIPSVRCLLMVWGTV